MKFNNNEEKMAVYTNFDYNKKSIKEWIKSYESGEFHCKNEASIHSAGWLMWEQPKDLPKHIEALYEAIKMVQSTGKMNENEIFIRLKEVPKFGRENYNYANVIFYQELNNTPIIVITPDYEGHSELFLINNKHKVTGSLNEIKDYLVNDFSM